MTRVLIANMLTVAAESKSSTNPKYMGVEFSPPVSMAGAAVVAVAGTVREVVRVGERCDAEIQGSNDLIRWSPVGSATTLPNAPGSFEVSGVGVSFAWVRVRWVIRSNTEILQNAMWVITAELNTNVG